MPALHQCILSSFTSFCYLPRVREKTGSAELRTRRQTQFPIIWVGIKKGEVRKQSCQHLVPMHAPRSLPLFLPSYLRHGCVMPSGPQAPEEWRAVESHDRGHHQVTATEVREELAGSRGLMPHLKANGPLSASGMDPPIPGW